MTRGRQKIEMKLIEATKARQVCFSKRRAGIFKKASELCTLCAVHIGMIIFSPGGKAFSFGHPSLDKIFNRLVHHEDADDSSIQRQPDHRAHILAKLNKTCNDIYEQLESEKKQADILKKLSEKSQGKRLMDLPPDDLSLEEMLMLKGLLEERLGCLQKHREELASQTSNPPGFFKHSFDLNVSASSSSVDADAADHEG
ncbi:hypothetical protein K2173_002566 [Erythroxylum novogranatense]|uniref:MADS-box domain-containing protein n=1 Tax=Erythroxylum novogranatense TaxID=1862640 RepID=A0AAV8TQY6_9ROSI|nr:hypothetical protein K2173_002566 [Erythroxylum novogranatense]